MDDINKEELFDALKTFIRIYGKNRPMTATEVHYRLKDETHKRLVKIEDIITKINIVIKDGFECNIFGRYSDCEMPDGSNECNACKSLCDYSKKYNVNLK